MTTNARWYTDARVLRAAREKYKTFDAMADALGGADPKTLSHWWRRHGLEKLPKGPQPNAPLNEEAMEELYASIYGHPK